MTYITPRDRQRQRDALEQLSRVLISGFNWYHTDEGADFWQLLFNFLRQRREELDAELQEKL
jgi:hypothetical protein